MATELTVVNPNESVEKAPSKASSKAKTKAKPKAKPKAQAKAKAKPKAKPKAKATAKPKEKTPVDRKMAKIPVGERRKNLVKLLKKVNATNAGEAYSIGDLAEKLGYTKFDVYGLVNGTGGEAGSSPNCLVAQGIVKTYQVEGVRGISVYLTKKGLDADFSLPPFVRSEKVESE